VFRRGVIDHEIDDHADAAFVAGFDHILKVLQCAIVRVHILVICDIIAMIRRRRKDRHQPDSADPKIGRGVWISIVEIVELLNYSAEVTNPIAVAVIERAHKDLIEDDVIPPAPGRFGCLFRSNLFGRCGC